MMLKYSKQDWECSYNEECIDGKCVSERKYFSQL